VVYLTSGFGGAPLAPEQERFRLDADGVVDLVTTLAPEELNAAAGGRVSLGWGVHSLRACPPGEWDRAVRAFSADRERPVHIHLSEQPKEVAESRAELGAPPIRWALDHAEVDQRWCLVHCTHASEDEMAAMARAGAVVGLCPATEANLGDGLFPLEAWLGAGGAYGVGTDSHVSTGAATELRTLEYGQRLVTGTRGVVRPAPPLPDDVGTGTALVGRALAGGARALGRPGGDLGIGLPADIVVLDPDHPSLISRDEATVLDAWVFADHGNPVRDVMVGGRWVVQAGRHRREEEILSRYRTVMRSLAERL
jgi:formimidoylglutamate deiminase